MLTAFFFSHPVLFPRIEFVYFLCHNGTMSVKVVFAGGGTGGHIYPGLAVCNELKTIARNNSIDLQIYWIGNSSGMDKEIIEKSESADFFIPVPSGKLRRYFSLKNFSDIFKIAAAFFISFFKLLRIRPALLFSKGGFVSVPPCIAAKLLGIPVYTHECDFTPGLATKINSRVASKILLSYEETKKFFPSSKQNSLVVCGNPVRRAFYESDAKKGLEFIFKNQNKPSKPVLFVCGGSLGARQINSLVAQNLDWLCSHFYVVHQYGKANEDSVLLKNESYFPFPFIHSQICDVLACADFVVSRAGANSLWEAAVSCKPMVLIPLAGNGTRGDQIDNADYFEKKGCAVVLKGEVSSEEFKITLEKFLDSSYKEQMVENLKKFNSEKSNPAKFIAELIFNGSIKNT